MTFDPSGEFVYVACQGGGVNAYAFDVTTGILTPITGSLFPAGNAPLWVASAKLQ